MSRTTDSYSREGLVLVSPYCNAHRAPGPSASPGQDANWAETRMALLDKYMGFEGDLWPLSVPPVWQEYGLAPLESFAEVVEAYNENASVPGIRLLFCSAGGQSHSGPPALPCPCSFAGYDFGNLESAWNYYSCLYYEVLCGQVKELSGFSQVLNAQSLFPTPEHASLFAAARRRVARRQPDVMETFEHDEAPTTFSIFIVEPCIR